VARALDAAHASGLVHRDVKPANILLQRSPAGEVEHVYLSDFGVMKHTSSISGLTKTGALVGTIDYMAPEQIEGHDVSPQTDVYALGCLFYQAVTGRVPHARESEAAALWAHMREDVEPASRIRPELPRAIDNVIDRALAKVPAARFETCKEFIRACSAAAAQRPEVERAPAVAASGSEPALAASAPSPAKPARGRAGWPALPDVRWLVAGLIVLVAGGIAAVIALTSGGSSSSSATGERFPATLADVPTNHVAGTGDAVVKLDGNSAAITVDTNGLLGAAPHAMHIHAGGRGKCPTAQAAHRHNGRLAISTVNGEPFYGPPVTAMTTQGDTSTKSILAFPRYPHVGDIRYTRTITVPAGVAGSIRNRKASVIVHGIDYNSNGIYDAVLDRSELDRRLPGEATAPALCGELVPAKGANADVGEVFTASLTIVPDDGGGMTGIAHHH
jgi:hypothetical protein